jgi:hypothetical protein
MSPSRQTSFQLPGRMFFIAYPIKAYVAHVRAPSAARSMIDLRFVSCAFWLNHRTGSSASSKPAHKNTANITAKMSRNSSVSDFAERDDR